MAGPTALELKTKGNAAYKLGDLSAALDLYFQANSLEPSAVLLSNASATQYELGLYKKALVTTVKAIDLEEKAGSLRSPALAAKLNLRRVKVLLQLRRYDEAVKHCEGAVGELATLGKLAARLAAIPLVEKSKAHKLVLGLPAARGTHGFKSLEYFALGHDLATSAFVAPNSADSAIVKRFDLDFTRKEPISCLIGGVGDGRHAMATLFDAFIKVANAESAKLVPQQPHVMLVDYMPASVARLFVMLSLLHDLHVAVVPKIGNNEASTKSSRALLAVLHYFYVAAIMPPSVRADLNSALRRARSRLSGTLSPRPHSPSLPWTSASTLPPWLHFSPTHYPALIAVIDFWLDPATTPRALVGSWIDRTTPRRRDEGIVPFESLDEAQFGVYGRIKILIPSESTLAQEPEAMREPLTRFMANQNEQDARACRDHVRDHWEANPTFLDPVTNDTPEIFDDPFRVIKSTHDFLLQVLPPDFLEDFDRLHDYTDWAFLNFSAFMNKWPSAVKLELVLGDVFNLLESMKLGVSVGRDPDFPTTWDHIWLSNIPEYTGAMVLPMTQLGVLKPLPSSFVTFYYMSCAEKFTSPRGTKKLANNSVSLTFLGVGLERLPTVFGAEYVDDDPRGAIWDFALFSPCPSPSRLPKIELINFIHSTFFRLAFPPPSEASVRPDCIRQPLTLASLFRILRRLHEVGYPAHHLTDALEPLLHECLITPVRPPPISPIFKPIPLSQHIRISTAPFLPELVVTASIYHHSLSFPISSSHIIPFSEIGRYRVKLRYAGWSAQHRTNAPTLVMMFTKFPYDFDMKGPGGTFRTALPLQPHTDAHLFQGLSALAVSVRVIKGGESANTVIINSSFNQAFLGDPFRVSSSPFWTFKRTDVAWPVSQPEYDITFNMPKRTVEMLWSERWYLKMLDMPEQNSPTEEIVCTKESVAYLGSLLDQPI
ncbi:hypothetical protein P7C70_g7085, partial [Phenoliferia sp. Uapishka_3]